MSEAYIFEGHIEGNRIVPDVPLNLPDQSHVRVRLELVKGEAMPGVRSGKQDLNEFAGKTVTPQPLQARTLSREEIYRDDD